MSDTDKGPTDDLKDALELAQEAVDSPQTKEAVRVIALALLAAQSRLTRIEEALRQIHERVEHEYGADPDADDFTAHQARDVDAIALAALDTPSTPEP